MLRHRYVPAGPPIPRFWSARSAAPACFVSAMTSSDTRLSPVSGDAARGRRPAADASTVALRHRLAPDRPGQALLALPARTGRIIPK